MYLILILIINQYLRTFFHYNQADFLMKSVTTLITHDVYSKSHRFRVSKLTFADWLKFSLIENLTCEIDVRLKKKIWPLMRQLDWKLSKTEQTNLFR
jgi:hypothetical protein